PVARRSPPCSSIGASAGAEWGPSSPNAASSPWVSASVRGCERRPFRRAMTRTITSSFAVPKGGASAVLLVLALLAPLGTAKAATPQEECHAAYREATNALLAERYEEAVLELQWLVQTAPTAADGRLASALLSVARTPPARSAEEAPELRSRDELSVLYSTAFVYGLGTSAWLTLQIKPQTVAGALLPFAAITTAAVGSVAVADNYRPLRRGLAHSIAAGLY